MVRETHFGYVLNLDVHFLSGLAQYTPEIKILSFESQVGETKFAYELDHISVGVVHVDYLKLSIVQPRNSVCFHARIEVYSNIGRLTWLKTEILLADTEGRTRFQNEVCRQT